MENKNLSKQFLFILTLLVTLNTWTFGQTTNHFPDTGNVGVGTVTPENTGNYSIIDIVGKNAVNGGYISLSTSDKSGHARMFLTHERLLFDLRKAGMYFQWRNSASKQIYRLDSDGSAIWNGFGSGSTVISSNPSGQYIRQYGNDGSSQSWLIRGYASNGVQAEFNNGGINVNGVIKTKEGSQCHHVGLGGLCFQS